MTRLRKPPTVEVFEGLSGRQTAEAFLEGLRNSRDLVVDAQGLTYWQPPGRAGSTDIVYQAWMVRLVAYELDRRNEPVEAELRRKGLM